MDIIYLFIPDNALKKWNSKLFSHGQDIKKNFF